MRVRVINWNPKMAEEKELHKTLKLLRKRTPAKAVGNYSVSTGSLQMLRPRISQWLGRSSGKQGAWYTEGAGEAEFLLKEGKEEEGTGGRTASPQNELRCPSHGRRAGAGESKLESLRAAHTRPCQAPGGGWQEWARCWRPSECSEGPSTNRESLTSDGQSCLFSSELDPSTALVVRCPVPLHT